MSMPGFDAELSLSPTTGRYQGHTVLGRLSAASFGGRAPFTIGGLRFTR